MIARAGQYRSAGDEERAQELYVILCEEREVGEACTMSERWERGCALESKRSCLGGMEHATGEAWLAFGVAACTLGDAATCWTVGSEAAYRRDPADMSTARPAWERGCELGNDLSCIAAGDLNRTDGDYVEAIRLYDGACDDALDLGCELAVGAREVAADLSSCTDGDVAACQRACPVVTDDAICTNALEATTKACDRRDGEACTLLGHIYGAGRGVDADLDRANVLLWLACDLDDAVACLRLEDNLSHGRGAEPPGCKPISWLRIQVCDLQMDYGCAPHRFWQ